MADLSTPKLASRPRSELETSLRARIAERFAAARQLAADAEAAAASVVAYALGETPALDAESFDAVVRACGDPAGRGDEVAALLDAVRGRQALAAGALRLSARQVAALAGRSRPAVTAALTARPRAAEVLGYLSRSPFALAPWRAAGAPAGAVP